MAGLIAFAISVSILLALLWWVTAPEGDDLGGEP